MFRLLVGSAKADQGGYDEEQGGHRPADSRNRSRRHEALVADPGDRAVARRHVARRSTLAWWPRATASPRPPPRPLHERRLPQPVPGDRQDGRGDRCEGRRGSPRLLLRRRHLPLLLHARERRSLHPRQRQQRHPLRGPVLRHDDRRRRLACRPSSTDCGTSPRRRMRHATAIVRATSPGRPPRDGTVRDANSASGRRGVLRHVALLRLEALGRSGAYKAAADDILHHMLHQDRYVAPRLRHHAHDRPDHEADRIRTRRRRPHVHRPVLPPRRPSTSCSRAGRARTTTTGARSRGSAAPTSRPPHIRPPVSSPTTRASTARRPTRRTAAMPTSARTPGASSRTSRSTTTGSLAIRGRSRQPIVCKASSSVRA